MRLGQRTPYSPGEIVLETCEYGGKAGVTREARIRWGWIRGQVENQTWLVWFAFVQSTSDLVRLGACFGHFERGCWPSSSRPRTCLSATTLQLAVL